MRKRSQVIIVGGGPVGVGLAVDLGLRGISCALVERRVGMHKIPKGQNLAQRTLERCYFWGCVDELRAQRLLPPEVPVSGVTAYKSLMSEYWHAFAGRETVNEFYFQKNDRMPQYLLENVLRRKMASLPLVEAHIRGRLLVFFPGIYEQDNYRLLDARDGWNYHAVPITASEGEIRQ